MPESQMPEQLAAEPEVLHELSANPTQLRLNPDMVAARSMATDALKEAWDQSGKAAKKWNDKVEKDSVIKFACPFEVENRKRPLFDTKAKCRKYTKEKYPVQMEQAKLTKTKVVIDEVKVAPKRTQADLMGILVDQSTVDVQAIMEAQKNSPVIQRLNAKMNAAPQGMVGRAKLNSANDREKWAAKTTSELMQMTTRLAAHELQSLGHYASSMCNMEITRACRKHLRKFDQTPTW